MNTEYNYAKISSAAHTEETKKIIDALRAANGVYIDDHNDSERVGTSVIVLNKLEKDGITVYDQYVCAAGEWQYFCLNPIVVEDSGELHLLRGSVGGVIEVASHGGLQQAVEAFNKHGWIGSPSFVELVTL